MWCQFIDLLKFETRPSSLLNFGTANYQSGFVSTTVFDTFMVRKLAAIFISCSAKSHLLKVLEMKQSSGWQLTK